MAEPTHRRQIEQEAEDHIALGLLLRRKRSREKQAEVRRIMAGPEAVARKIERIRRLDAPPPQAAEAEAATPEEAAERSPDPRALSLVKAHPAPASFWSFAFKELPRLRAFGRRTHTLQVSLLPPAVRADPALKTFFTRSLPPWAGELAGRLQPVLEMGWLHLTKRQYNGLALLARLCERVQATDFTRLAYGERGLIDRLRRLEALFLLLRSSKDVVADLQGSLRTVFEKKSRLDSEYRPAAELVDRILGEEGSLPSLHNCLLALNMVKARRFLKLEDLIRGDLPEAVSDSEFDCSPAVREKIREYVDSTLETLAALHAQLSEVRRLGSYLDYDEAGELDTRLLAAFYESKEPGASQRLEADRENLMLLAPRLFASFERVFLPLLAGSLPVEGQPRAVLFEPLFFQTEFTRLAGVVERLEQATFGYAHFPYSRYLAIRGSNLGAIPKELEVLQMVDVGLSILLTVGKSLVRVLGGSGVGLQGGEPEAPLSPSVLQGRRYRVPYAERRILPKGFLHGLTVTEALRRAASLCFASGVLLQDPAVFQLFGREGKLASQLAAALKQVEHLVDAKTFAELKLRYV